MDPHLRHPFTGIVAGPTACGKSTWVKHLITYHLDMIDPAPEHVIWFYGEWQPLYDTLSGLVEFRDGLFDLTTLTTKKQTLIIIDNLMTETDKSVSNLFTKGSHHRNLSVLHLVQNVFDKNKHTRTIILNAHYLVIFKILEMPHKLPIWPSKCTQVMCDFCKKSFKMLLQKLMGTYLLT